MQNESSKRNPITPEEARQLVQRLSNWVREHAELQAEVSELRESMEMFSALRDLVYDSAPALHHVASNGHVALPVTHDASHGAPNAGDRAGALTALIDDDPTDEDAGDALNVESPALDDASSDDAGDGPVVKTLHLDDDPADCPQDDGAVSPPPLEPSSVKSDPGECPLVPDAEVSPSAETETGKTAESPTSPPSELDADAPSGEMRPPPGTLMERIFDLIDQSPRPKRAWQIEKELALARLPHAELSRMVSQGHLERLREGVYGIAGRTYSAVAPSEGNDA